MKKIKLIAAAVLATALVLATGSTAEAKDSQWNRSHHHLAKDSQWSR
jgi:ABC-type glycerol-3-phosphate transport system substrate-binding protein